MDFSALERSGTAKKEGIDNTLPERLHAVGAGLLVIMARIRSRKGAYTTSAYRCPALNARVGGKKNSYHLKAQALDFYGWTKDEVLSDMLLARGVQELKVYDDGRIHMAWEQSFLERQGGER